VNKWRNEKKEDGKDGHLKGEVNVKFSGSSEGKKRELNETTGERST
jgi:hypothetical protein